jgi:hypothetical protein
MKKGSLIAGYILLVAMFFGGVYSAVTGTQLAPGYDGIGVALFSGLVLAAAVWTQSRKTAAVAGVNTKATDVLVFVMPVRKRLMAATLLTGLSAAFYLLMQSAPERKLWFFQAGFALFAALALVAVLTIGRQVSLTLTREGLDYTPFRVGLILWRDIRGFQIKRLRYFDSIALDIVAPERYRSRHILRRILGAHFDVSPTIFGQDTEWLASEIKKRIVAFGPRARELSSSFNTSTEAP